MSVSKLTYNPVIGGEVVPGFAVIAWTPTQAAMLIDLAMQRRGYWNRLKQWALAGREVKREEEVIDG